MTNNEIQNEIKLIIKKDKIVLFMKGTPDFPQCGFSAVVVQILKNMGYSFNYINVLENHQLREGIKKYSNWPTIPQLYIKGQFIGGCDIVKELYKSGKLNSYLNI